MANMSYCRFRNTYQALEDCGIALAQEETEKLSNEEKIAMKKLLKLCAILAFENGYIDDEGYPRDDV